MRFQEPRNGALNQVLYSDNAFGIKRTRVLMATPVTKRAKVIEVVPKVSLQERRPQLRYG